jgi:hypothetical protein
MVVEFIKIGRSVLHIEHATLLDIELHTPVDAHVSRYDRSSYSVIWSSSDLTGPYYTV